jgi:hypothetical protein
MVQSGYQRLEANMIGFAVDDPSLVFKDSWTNEAWESQALRRIQLKVFGITLFDLTVIVYVRPCYPNPPALLYCMNGLSVQAIAANGSLEMGRIELPFQHIEISQIISRSKNRRWRRRVMAENMEEIFYDCSYHVNLRCKGWVTATLSTGVQRLPVDAIVDMGTLGYGISGRRSLAKGKKSIGQAVSLGITDLPPAVDANSTIVLDGRELELDSLFPAIANGGWESSG